jgi:hypothetical protein
VSRRHPAAWAGLGIAGLLGYGTLKAVWALGGTWGVTDPARWRGDLAALAGPELLAAFWGTVVLDLAGLALVLLLARAAGRGGAPPVLRVVAWLGVVVLGIASVAGLLATVTLPSPAGADPLATWVYLVVYGSFGLVALALCRLALLSRRPRVP